MNMVSASAESYWMEAYVRATFNFNLHQYYLRACVDAFIHGCVCMCVHALCPHTRFHLTNMQFNMSFAAYTDCVINIDPLYS